MDPEKIMEEMSLQLSEALMALKNSTAIEEKVAYSQVVKNLSDAMGVFLNLAADSMMEDYDFEDD
ncbi:MAG: hypothetical protein PHZ02_06085 [Desulfocapsaceae bacterium]|nr:hypothetical protein [Desulfocapsaceae bacterium]